MYGHFFSSFGEKEQVIVLYEIIIFQKGRSCCASSSNGIVS